MFSTWIVCYASFIVIYEILWWYAIQGDLCFLKVFCEVTHRNFCFGGLNIVCNPLGQIVF